MKFLIKPLLVFLNVHCLFFANANSDTIQRNMDTWLVSSLQRVFPQSPVKTTPELEILAARSGRVSFQVAFHSNMKDQTHISCNVENAAEVNPQVRLVGLVPMPHFNTDVSKEELDGTGYLPGWLPDPLYPVNKTEANPFESRSFWITLHIPATLAPGIHRYPVRLTWQEGREEKSSTLYVNVRVGSLVIQPRKDFHVTHWWRGEAISLQYKTKLFDEKWWQLTRACMKNLIEHGNDVAFIQNFFELRAVFQQPCQMLIVKEPSPGRYEFDWSLVKRFVAMCRELGYKKFEWAHLWLYWGVQNAMHIYKKEGDAYRLLWDENLPATSGIYINFLKQYLPSLHDFLLKENMLNDSYFHLSDEPWSEHIDNYKKARDILRRLAPWMKVMDALSDVRYGREHLTDIPVPIISSDEAYRKENIPHWVYFCTGPRNKWLNRLYDTPLAKIRMSGWLFYRLKAQGFLHWGYNFWYKLDREEAGDPFTEGAAYAYPGIAAGDPFAVYPGPDGPYDSIRWEVFSESLQDYAILQTAGVQPDDVLLSALHSYEDFPKSEQWINEALKKVFNKDQ
ncbi:hypothetical protein A8C56_13435 [Niabella ginsenosidivorans]|uniref:Glycoside hydrolase 123 catalytic domain-containing protein n=1 Tax=Niabella ginsenosidivorans TaxID=1176587 RepID=A0A1A9I3E2_9BACT|nr:DUF4091 domain-containing protein [Niabella ginsenosidivorans]ANH81845.1 hypothetical protein A8C56_13435 [Niabella ginsenosidivorans]